MRMITVRVDEEVERALEYLQEAGGMSRSEAIRVALLDAEREARRAALRAESEAIRDDPEERRLALEWAREAAEMAAEADERHAW
ncbi:MAG: ribbon-helix-helix protein, CopG family [Microbacteriaceae bacterium]|nr:ribbon-helix-helix protein, CopG family [Microbacteriaceae bacterium]